MPTHNRRAKIEVTHVYFFSIILYLPVWYCRKCVVDRGNGSEADDDNLDADIAMLEKKERSVERV